MRRPARGVISTTRGNKSGTDHQSTANNTNTNTSSSSSGIRTRSSADARAVVAAAAAPYRNSRAKTVGAGTVATKNSHFNSKKRVEAAGDSKKRAGKEVKGKIVDVDEDEQDREGEVEEEDEDDEEEEQEEDDDKKPLDLFLLRKPPRKPTKAEDVDELDSFVEDVIEWKLMAQKNKDEKVYMANAELLLLHPFFSGSLSFSDIPTSILDNQMLARFQIAYVVMVIEYVSGEPTGMDREDISLDYLSSALKSILSVFNLAAWDRASIKHIQIVVEIQTQLFYTEFFKNSKVSPKNYFDPKEYYATKALKPGMLTPTQQKHIKMLKARQDEVSRCIKQKTFVESFPWDGFEVRIKLFLKELADRFGFESSVQVPDTLSAAAHSSRLSPLKRPTREDTELDEDFVDAVEDSQPGPSTPGKKTATSATTSRSIKKVRIDPQQLQSDMLNNAPAPVVTASGSARTSPHSRPAAAATAAAGSSGSASKSLAGTTGFKQARPLIEANDEYNFEIIAFEEARMNQLGKNKKIFNSLRRESFPIPDNKVPAPSSRLSLRNSPRKPTKVVNNVVGDEEDQQDNHEFDFDDDESALHKRHDKGKSFLRAYASGAYRNISEDGVGHQHAITSSTAKHVKPSPKKIPVVPRDYAYEQELNAKKFRGQREFDNYLAYLRSTSDMSSVENGHVPRNLEHFSLTAQVYDLLADSKKGDGTALPKIDEIKRQHPQYALPRGRIKWTDEEVDALDRGMCIFGRKWSKILRADEESERILCNRSKVDLKDKARVERRRREREGLPMGGFAIAALPTPYVPSSMRD